MKLLPEIQIKFRPTNPPETLMEMPQNYCRGSLTQKDQQQAPARCAWKAPYPHLRTESWNPPHRNPEPESRVKAAPWGHCSRAQHGRGTPRTPGAAQRPRPHAAPTCRRSSTARRSMGHVVGRREQHVPVAMPAQPRRDRSWWAHSGPQAPPGELQLGAGA